MMPVRSAVYASRELAAAPRARAELPTRQLPNPTWTRLATSLPPARVGGVAAAPSPAAPAQPRLRLQPSAAGTRIFRQPSGGGNLPQASPREIVVAATSPFAIAAVQTLAEDALDRASHWASSTYAGNSATISQSLNKGTADAMRHAYW
ncbi:MAG: hypothetical protein GEU90_20685, partial [Gemmatimonas sp.]|nr:hypothetical protein [Gemmatimonas sp.]